MRNSSSTSSFTSTPILRRKQQVLNLKPSKIEQVGTIVQID
jgi:hypothetical protein